MPRTVKTLEYRRARWLDAGQNLEELARAAWGNFGTQLERTIIRSGNRSISGLRAHDFGQRGFAIHCARYTNGQSVGTVPMAPAANAEVGERQPNAGENFMSSDFMALLKDNHLVVMNCGRNAGALRDFLTALFAKADFADATRQVELVRIGDLNKLAMIEAVGVKTVDLKVDIAEATAVDMAQDGAAGFWTNAKNEIAGAFRAITAQDENISQLRLAEQGTVTVSINVKKGDLEVAKSGLDQLAEAVADDDEAESFVIHLRNSQTIKADEVTVKKQVRLDEVANSVSVQQAWDEMATYYDELMETGQIEA